MSDREYDGVPYFCVTCGEPFHVGCFSDECRVESEASARMRAQRRRPKETAVPEASQ